jgi:hypothetical protein
MELKGVMHYATQPKSFLGLSILEDRLTIACLPITTAENLATESL